MLTTVGTEWKDPYIIKRPITESQQDYNNLLEKTFNVYNLKERRLMPYNMVNWQKEFHAYSINCLHPSKWKDRLVRKGRGISFSVSSVIDHIMSANKFDNMIFPLVSHRQDAGWDLIKVGQTLIDQANFDFDVVKDAGGWTNGKIIFGNGSIIKFFPSGNINSLRQVRTFATLFDECNFYRDIKGILDAGEDCLNQGGQATLGSTVYDRNNYFWEMCEQEKELNNKYMFDLPTFNPSEFDVNKNILEQVKDGLQPLTWWLNLQKLEDKRERDYTSLLRENQCQPSDEGVSFIKIQHIMKNIDESLFNYQKPFVTQNILTAGMDIATEHDLATVSIFEHTKFGKVQRHIEEFKNVELPDLQDIHDDYMDNWNIFRFRLDSTGMGHQLGQHAKRKYGSRSEPIHFAKSIKTNLKGINEPIREKIAYNMREELVCSRVKILEHTKQRKHLNGWSWDLKKYLGTTEDHGDHFWSTGLALLPLDYKVVNKGPLVSISTKKKKPIPIDLRERNDIKW